MWGNQEMVLQIVNLVRGLGVNLSDLMENDSSYLLNYKFSNPNHWQNDWDYIELVEESCVDTIKVVFARPDFTGGFLAQDKKEGDIPYALEFVFQSFKDGTGSGMRTTRLFGHKLKLIAELIAENKSA
jgi:hypothetical protein